MMNNSAKAFCLFCVLIGAVLPWGLIIAGAAISVFASSPYWGETAAYFTVMGLILMAGSYLLTRVHNMMAERQE